MVVGPVGCGKSTLLHAILGNCAVDPSTTTTTTTSDHNNTSVKNVLRRPQRVAYVSQEAWITDGTVRSNILLGLPFDEAKYRDVLYACSLEDDLMQWGGDEIEVAKGVTLSEANGSVFAWLGMLRRPHLLFFLDDPTRRRSSFPSLI